jgi:hypothetical protein
MEMNTPIEQPSKGTRRLTPWRIAMAAGFGTAVLGLVGAGIYAGLQAQATGTEQISTGKLSLTLTAATPSAGFPATFAALMAPGDTDNIAVNLNNNGTLNAASPVTLGVTSSIVNATLNANLDVTLTSCTVAWTMTVGSSTAAPTCSGTTAVVLAATPVTTLAAATNLTLPAAFLTAGGASSNLLVTTSIPSSYSENVINGTLPGSTLQALTNDTFTFTFTEQQRTGLNNNA